MLAGSSVVNDEHLRSIFFGDYMFPEADAKIYDEVVIVMIKVLVMVVAYMQKTCDVAEKAILAKKNLRKKCVNRDKM